MFKIPAIPDPKAKGADRNRAAARQPRRIPENKQLHEAIRLTRQIALMRVATYDTPRTYLMHLELLMRQQDRTGFPMTDLTKCTELLRGLSPIRPLMTRMWARQVVNRRLTFAKLFDRANAAFRNSRPKTTTTTEPREPTDIRPKSC